MEILITKDMIVNEHGHGDASLLISKNNEYWFPGWDNFPSSAVVDLGRKYLIDTISFQDMEGEGDYLVEVGQPGEWLTLWEGKTDKRGEYVKKTLAHTRYVRITLLEAGSNINSLEVNGEIAGSSSETHELQIIQNGNIIKTLPVSEDVSVSFKKVPFDGGDDDDGDDGDNDPPIPTEGVSIRTFDQFVQTNVLMDDPVDIVAPVSGGGRGYLYLKWLQGDVSNQNLSDPLSKVKINFDPIDAFSFNMDESVRRFSQLGDFYLTLFESAMWLTDNDKTWLNAVAYRRKDGRSGLDQPHRWSYAGHLYYQVAARYGRTEVPLNTLVTNSEKKTGLGYCRYIEGANEMERWWIGYDKADLSPEELAAYMSAIYDGHLGQINEDGLKFGAKTADPSIKVMLGGLAFVDFDELINTGNSTWFDRFFKWCESNRNKNGYDMYPFDVICYHDYPNTERKQRNLSGKGLHPEGYKWYEKTKALKDYIANRIDKQVELHNNEFGYDRNQSSPQRAEPYGPFNSEQVAGFWTMRCMLEGWAAGLDVGAQFYFRDNQSNGGGIFQSSGLTDKSRNYYRFQMYYYMATGRHAFKSIDFVSRRVEGDKIIIEGKHRKTSKKAYAIWHYTTQNKRSSYSLGVNSDVTITHLADNEMEGRKLSKSPIGGNVQIDVSELPTFIVEK